MEFFQLKCFESFSRYLIRILIILNSSIFLNFTAFAQRKNTVITIVPIDHVLMTEVIQKAIDKCAASGGGTVKFTEGTYLSGSLELRSNVTLQIVSGAILQGSSIYSDYRNEAFIFGQNISNVSIVGEGIIDGVDCYNPKGEEKFRGPHGIRLISCRNIIIEGVTIKNAANWAINCRHTSKVKIKNVFIQGGHDGLHTRFCDAFNVTGCDFRTGDDAFAGNDNRDFIVTDCKINTSCNGFRMGCYNLTVKDCKFWGPGEYMHKIQKRNNMLAAFVHFSPKDEAPQMSSGKWLIENVTIDKVDHVYMYNYRDGLWQTGKTVGFIQFKNVKATEILSAFNIIGDTLKQFSLKVKKSTFTFRNGAIYTGDTFEGSNIDSPSFFYARNFSRIFLQNVILNNSGSHSTLKGINGNLLLLKDVRFNLNCSEPYIIKSVESVIEKNIKICLANH
jgi:hypothetical protein